MRPFDRGTLRTLGREEEGLEPVERVAVEGADAVFSDEGEPEAPGS
jgi:hypothetical protein